jgi:hypothetical protein
MVPSAGAETGVDRVRPLNLPRPILVTLDEVSGLPRVLHERNRRQAIERIQDAWWVDDEWWREPISRRYLQVMLRDGALRTIFHDRIANVWFAQAY